MLGSLKVHFSLQRSPRTSRKNIYKLIKDRNFSISWANLYFCVGWLGRTLCPRWVKYFLWRRSFPPTQIKGGNLNYSIVSIGTSTSVVDQIFGSGSWNLLQYGFGFKHFHIRLLHCQFLRTFFTEVTAHEENNELWMNCCPSVQHFFIYSLRRSGFVFRIQILTDPVWIRIQNTVFNFVRNHLFFK